MTLKFVQSPAFDEIASIPEARSTDVPRLKGYYKALYGQDTTLSDDDILNVIAYSDDDNDPNIWAAAMKEMESGTFTTETFDNLNGIEAVQAEAANA